MSRSAALIVLAAGGSTRFGATDNKVLAPLGDRPVLSYALEAADPDLVDTVVVVARPQEVDTVRSLSAAWVSRDRLEVVPGGGTRQASELAGLTALAPHIEGGSIGIVAIHDGARPFVTRHLLDSVLAHARTVGGAVPGYPPVDAVWQVEDGLLTAPLAKSGLRTVQTPQAFTARPLLDAYRRADADGFVGADTAATVSRYTELAIEVVAGDANNLKLTHPEDMERAEQLSRRWVEAEWVVS